MNPSATCLGNDVFGHIGIAQVRDRGRDAEDLFDLDCAEAGVKAVSVLADGFAEAGELGRERQARLTAMA